MVRILASAGFVALAVFLVMTTWVPGAAQLRRESAQVAAITAQANTWYEVEILTVSGARLTCRTRRGWPLLGPDRCPLERFERVQGQLLQVMHDGLRPYDVIAGAERVVDMDAHKSARAIAVMLALLLLAMAAGVWWRPR